MSYRLRYSLILIQQDAHIQGLIRRVRAILSHGQRIALLLRVTTTTRHFFLAALLAFSVGTPAFAAGAKAPKDSNMPQKVDKALAGQLKGGTAKNKVIITVKPGYRGSIRKALELHGGKIKREHASLNVFVAELDTATILQLASDPLVTALSLDGPMTASQLATTVAVSPTVTVSPTTVAPGSVITVSVAGGPANVGDWVALF